jgi:hypothetical protein
MDYCLFILGNGRRGYLERTIASWTHNLKEVPKYAIIFDDSNDPKYVKYLSKKYGKDFEIVPIFNNNLGHAGAMSFIFNYLQNKDVEYFLQIEEDWMLFRSLSIQEIISVMRQNQDVLQMRISRSIWYNPEYFKDLSSGSLLRNHTMLPNVSWSQEEGWYRWRGPRYYWTHNPSVFNKKILEIEYPQVNVHGQHENMFGNILYEKYPDSCVGFWSSNFYDAYITHIGFYDEKLLQHIGNNDLPYFSWSQNTLEQS